MKKAITLFAFLLFVVSENVIAQNQSLAAGWSAGFKHEKVFIENQGQFDGLNDNGAAISFASDYDNTQFLFTPNGVTYRLTYTRQPNKEERQAIERRMKKMQAEGKDISHDDIEREEHRAVFYKELIQAQWVNANPNVKIVAEDKTSHYYTYTLRNGKLDHVSAFKKITYKDLYPNIDVVYEFHPTTGIEYSFIVHPGGDMSQVKMSYSGANRVEYDNANGEVQLLTNLGVITEHAPKTFYKNNPSSIIPSSFSLQGNDLTFSIANYDKSQEIIVDPWVAVAPTFATQWDCVWEIEKDGAGNAYLIGGTMPMQLLKYNTAGALQWTHSTPYDTTSWLGTFAVDNAGNSYVTLGSVAQIEKVSPAGAQIWSNTSPGGLLGNTEFWTIAFNCDQTKLIIGGTGGALLNILPYIYDVDMASGNVTASVQVTGGALFPTQEVRAITACGNAKYYYLTHDSIGYIQQNLTACSTPGSLPFHVSNSYAFGYKCENWRLNNTGIAAIRYYKGFIYTCRGNQIHKRNFNTGAIIATATIPGGNWTSNQVRNSGIDIDSCGNIFVGSANQLVKYDVNLNQLATYPTSVNFNIYDVAVGTSGDVIVGGSTGTSSSGARQGYIQSIATGACAPIAITCCNANICQVPPKCSTDGPVTLVVATPGGTFSGNGVNATTGVFTPSVAGVGVHKIVYTLPCGADSIFITVNSCTAVSVCKEANGNLTASGGTGPYTWSYWQYSTTTTVTNAATCTACGGTWNALFGQCLNGIFPVTSCTTPAGWVQFTTGVTVTPPAGKDSIRVVDNAGTTVVMYGLATVPLCSPCPTITVTTTPTNATCGLSNGSATTTVTGGVTPYTYTWNNSAVTSSITNVAAGTYTVTVKDANQCSGTATVTIGTSAGPTATSTKTDANCNGANNGSMTVTASGGTGTLTYTWSPNVSTTSSATSLAPNTYSVTVKDANNCTVVTSQTVGQPSAVTIATSNVPASCGGNNGSATATPSGGTGAYTYTWTGGATTATAPNLAAGTYSVTVRDANLCSATASVTVGASTALTIALTTTQPNCGNNNGKIKVTVSAGTGPYSYVWSNGAVSDSIINLAPNTYSVTVTGAGGCTASATTTINTSSAITLSTSTTAATCGNNNGKAKVTILTGTGPYTYLWSNAATADSINNVAGGAYQVTVTGAGGCSATATATIANTGAPTLTLGAVNATCNGVSNGSADVTTITGGTAPYTYVWNTGETTQGIVNKPAGTYTVTVTGSAGGSSTTVYAEDFDGASAANWQLNVATGVNGADPNFWKISDEEGGVLPPGCGVATNGNKTLFVTSVFNPTGGAAYDAGGLCGILFCPQTNTSAVSPLISTVGFSGLTLSFDFIGNGDGLLDNCSLDYSTNGGGAWTSLSPSLKSTTCGGGQGQWTAFSTALPAAANNNANLKLRFVWTNNDDGVGTDPSFAVNNIKITQAGTGTACPAIQSVTITQPNPIVANVTAVQPNCIAANGSISLSPTGGTAPYTYTWSANAATGNSATASNLAAGTYTVTIQAGTSCQKDTTITLVAPNAPNANAGVDTSLTCVRNSIGLLATSSTAGVTFAWSNGTNSANTSVSSAGTFTVTVTNTISGCTASDAVIVTLNNTLPTVNAGIDTVLNCVRTSLTLQATSTTAGATFVWSNGSNTASTSASTANTYTVTATNPSNGCTASDAVNVTLNNTVPNVNAGLDQVLSCTSSTATLSGSSTTAGVTYAWSGPGIVSGGTTTAPNVNISGTYTLQVTDPANGCTASDAVNVTPDVNTPNIDAGLDQVLTCLVTSVTLTATSTTPGVTFAWSNGSNAASTTVNTANTYTVTVTNPGNSCIAVDQVVVTQNTQIPANVSAGLDQVLTCNLSTATLAASSTTPGVTYAWSNGLGNAATATTSSTGTYTVTVTNPANGCTATDAVDVTNGVQALSATITATDPKCNNFNDGNAVAQVNGGTGPFTYTWSSNPNGGNDSIADNLSAPQSVSVTVTDVNGCSTTATANIANPPAPVLTLLPQDTSVEYGSPVQLVASLSNFTAQSYAWSPSGFSCTACPNPIVNPSAANTTYTVTVTYNNGCTVSAQTLVKAEANNKLYVPNAFTPNKDGNNDIFNVFVSNYKEFSLAIFNRWGEKVFEGTTPEEVANRFPKYGWDGTYKGALQPVEVYAYYATVVFLNGEVQNLKGSVTLIR